MKDIVKITILPLLLVLFCLFVLLVTSNEPQPKGNNSENAKLSKSKVKSKIRIKKRKWKHYTPKHRNEAEYVPPGLDVADIAKQIRESNNSEDISELMNELYGTKHPIILDIVFRELDNPDVDIRLGALDLLSEFGNSDIFDDLQKALDDKSTDVREAAISLLDTVEIPGGSDFEADLIAKGLTDKSEDVRDTAMDVLADKNRSEFEQTAETSISSPYADVKENTLSELSNQPSIHGVNVMIEGLRDKDPEFRDEVLSALDDITDQEFHSYQEAKAWWSKNQQRYEKEFQDDDDEDEE